MLKLPDYIGPLAYGLKMGVILPGMDIVEKLMEPLALCHSDGLLGDGDVICITESIVARAQNNYVTIDDVAREIGGKLKLTKSGRIAVVFPIASRNRFSMIMKGIARSVPQGEVVVQLSFPDDEVGNQVIDNEFIEKLGKDLIGPEDLKGYEFKHPITGVDYINLYRETIEKEGARSVIFLSNNPLHILGFKPDGVIAADIHTREATKKTISSKFQNCISLDQVCNDGVSFSEWGLLGSNMSSGEKLKLAPRNGLQVVNQLKEKIKEDLNIEVEVMIYGDGAYLDPSSGIYELADPRAAFAVTDGLNCVREGFKYKYLADHCFHEEKKSADEIEAILSDNSRRDLSEDSIDKEGTTPRCMEDILASLADLVSGSADAGTPVVVIRGFLK
ncbi:MAG: coenzyme F420-0:L-glutamate ligase [Bacillota bacterium]